jgi:hypothetical protein
LAHQQIAQRDDGAGLAGPGRHHEQRAAHVILLERLRDAADRARLIKTLHDGAVDVRGVQRLERCAPPDCQFQLILGQKALDRARRIALVVPYPMVIAVAVENDRALPELLFKAVGIKLGLLLPDARIALGALRLHEAKRLCVIAPQHIVDEALAGRVRHAGDREFGVVAGPGEGPAGLGEQNVDEGVAGRRFVVVVRIGHRRIGGLGLRYVGPQRRDLGFELRPFGFAGKASRFRLLPRLYGIGKPPGGLLELGERMNRNGGVQGQCLRRKPDRGIGLGALAIGAHQPIGHMKQFADCRDGIGGRNGLGFMGSLVAEVLDDARLGDERRPEELLECRLVDARAERPLVGVLQARLAPVEPIDNRLQRQPRIDAGAARVGSGNAFGLDRKVVHVAEFGRQKGKLGHLHGPAKFASRLR